MSSAAAILPRALSRQLLLYRLMQRIKRHGSRRLNDLPAAMEKSMNSVELRRLWEEVEEAYDRDLRARRSTRCRGSGFC